ncbi:MAG: hypothetical protein AAGA78_20295, partial [Pseudomonadota bacterium]
MGTSGEKQEHPSSEEDQPLLAGLAVAGTPEKTTQDWTTKVFETELTHLDAHGCLDDPNALNGIALSGGGVRSAVVCLGVLGALAKE